MDVTPLVIGKLSAAGLLLAAMNVTPLVIGILSGVGLLVAAVVVSFLCLVWV
jgi:hypothetical protein